jgi:hypothetical protein
MKRQFRPDPAAARIPFPHSFKVFVKMSANPGISYTISIISLPPADTVYI